MELFNFDRASKKVGIYQLDAPIKLYSKFLIPLFRYEYEDFDTFEIPDSSGSKLFVVNEVVKAIQCGKNFYFDGVNLIGMNEQDALQSIHSEWEILKQNDEIVAYFCKKMQLTLYPIESKILWVIFDSYQRS